MPNVEIRPKSGFLDGFSDALRNGLIKGFTPHAIIRGADEETSGRNGYFKTFKKKKESPAPAVLFFLRVEIP
jgi:hypothetical protein